MATASTRRTICLTLFRCAQRTYAPLVIGNRMNEAQKMSWLRHHVNLWMSHQLSRRAGRHLPDTQSGFRLIHLETWASLPLTTERFEAESEMLMAFLAAGRLRGIRAGPGHSGPARQQDPSSGRLGALAKMVAQIQPA